MKNITSFRITNYLKIVYDTIGKFKEKTLKIAERMLERLECD